MKTEGNIVTVVTCTYNRSKLIGSLYDSLLKQTDKNFKWLVIDDGSSDDTCQLIDKFIDENQIEIDYIYKTNGGKHTALNYAFENIDTELTIIVDSDDFLKPQAIETVRNDYAKILRGGVQDIGILVYLKEYPSGEVIGEAFNDDALVADGIKYIINAQVKGDKAEVFLTDALKKYRFPVFAEEKFMGETVVFIPVYREYKCFVRNDSICVCEYLNGGLTKQGRKLRIDNPLGGMHNSLQYINNDIKLKLQIKNILLFAVYRSFAKKQGKRDDFIFPNRWLYALCRVPGKLLYFLWSYKYDLKGKKYDT